MWFAVVSLSVMHILSISYGPRWLFYATKPLPTILLTAIVLLNPTSLENYTVAIALGLLLSSLGDIFLMLPKERFRAGLGCFVLVQVLYSYAFALTFERYTHWLLLLAILLLGSIIYLLLLPNLKKEKWSIAIYLIVILFMIFNAIEAWQTSEFKAMVFAGVGAIIFVLSDLVLAIDRFRASSDFSRHVVMFTYYTAQLLIALSAILMI
ncbi:lysoplasmalogenase [Vibrio renipiscarius]|uniref:lysoplasmalogenase n=1 Tax=Vibrio renipiscarius TaxID=1461322 RepID=UPI00354F1E76